MAMAIDYGFKVFLELYSTEFARLIVEMGVLEKSEPVKALGPVELTVQERPLRVDFVISVGEKFVVVESKSEIS